MLNKSLYYLKRTWYSLFPKFLNIVKEDFRYDGEEYLFQLEDGTLLQFEDFDCEEECFRFLDGSRYYPIMEVLERDEDGKPIVWGTVAFMRR